MTTTIYQYPGCSTCKKAIKWLDAEGVEYRAVHIVAKTPAARTLKRLITRSGLPPRKFFNTSGRAYRAGGWSAKAKEMDAGQVADALAADGMLIKRPLLVTDDHVLVGFREDDWRSALT